MAKDATKAKISVNETDSVLEEVLSLTCYMDNDEEFIITVNPLISLKAVSQFVCDIVNNVFVEVDGETIYCPQYREAAMTYGIMSYYTDLKTDMDIEKIALFCYTPVYSQILNSINQKQLDIIISSVDQAIAYRTQEILSAQKDLLYKNLAALTTFTGVMEQIEKSTGHLDMDEIKNMLELLTNISQTETSNLFADLKLEKADVVTQ